MADFPLMFGKYELINRLAFGGMAEIFLAKMKGARGFEREVVIKRLLPQYSFDEEFIKMFQDEARILSQLHHGNIVQVIEFDQVGDDFYLAMEYISGCDLRDLLLTLKNQQISVPYEHICFILSELCQGLAYAHHFENIQIVHRDISPHNIFISWTGDVKIGDFGIAKASNRFHRTATGILKGKVCYMSPEQAKGLSLDERSDIFALGIVCYEIFTHEKFFDGLSEFEILEKIKNLSDNTITASEKIPDIFKPFLFRAVHPNMENRFQTMNEMKQAVLNIEIEQGLRHDKDSFALWLNKFRPNITQKNTHSGTKVLEPKDESVSLSIPQLFTEMSDTVKNPNQNISLNSEPLFIGKEITRPSPHIYQTDSTTMKLSDELRIEKPFHELPDTNTMFPAASPEFEAIHSNKKKTSRYLGVSGIIIILIVIFSLNKNPINSDQNQETLEIQAISTPFSEIHDQILAQTNTDNKFQIPEPAHLEADSNPISPRMIMNDSKTFEPSKVNKHTAKNHELQIDSSAQFKSVVTETNIKASQEQDTLLKTITGNMGLIEIQSVPVWLKVYKDGNLMGTTPITLSLPEGKYSVHLENKKVAIESSLEFQVLRKRLIRKSIQVY